MVTIFVKTNFVEEYDHISDPMIQDHISIYMAHIGINYYEKKYDKIYLIICKGIHTGSIGYLLIIYLDDKEITLKITKPQLYDFLDIIHNNLICECLNKIPEYTGFLIKDR